MATTFSVREAEAIAQELQLLHARVERQAMMVDNLVERLQALEEWRAAARAEGGA